MITIRNKKDEIFGELNKVTAKLEKLEKEHEKVVIAADKVAKSNVTLKNDISIINKSNNTLRERVVEFNNIKAALGVAEAQIGELSKEKVLPRKEQALLEIKNQKASIYDGLVRQETLRQAMVKIDEDISGRQKMVVKLLKEV